MFCLKVLRFSKEVHYKVANLFIRTSSLFYILIPAVHVNLHNQLIRELLVQFQLV